MKAQKYDPTTFSVDTQLAPSLPLKITAVRVNGAAADALAQLLFIY